MNKFLNKVLLFTAFTCGIEAKAQTCTITGIVNDHIDQHIIPGISIFIPEVDKRMMTDENGQYTFTHLRAGEYTVVFSYTGYIKTTKKITVKNNETSRLNVSLQADLLNLSEITVSASTTRQGENKMDMIAMQLQPVKSAQDLLRTVPGHGILPEGLPANYVRV